MPGGSNALERPDDPRGRHRGLQRIGLEPLVQGSRNTDIVMSCTKTACWRSVSFLEAPQQARERQQRSGVDRGRVGWHDREDRLDEPGHVHHERPVLLVGLDVELDQRRGSRTVRPWSLTCHR